MSILLWSKFHVHGICLTIPFTYYHVAPVIASPISAYCPSYFFSSNSFFFTIKLRLQCSLFSFTNLVHVLYCLLSDYVKVESC